MTTPPFSVLLLAWDDADPTVAVLGGAALPPTLPLVYELGARHPVVALFPHLPAESTAAPAALAAAESGASAGAAAEVASLPAATASRASAGPLDAATSGPGLRLLATAAPAGHQPVAASRLIGLTSLAPSTPAPTPDPAVAAGRPHAGSAGPTAHRQWPAASGRPLTGTGQAPAAPYAGAAPDPMPPAAPAGTPVLVRESVMAPAPIVALATEPAPALLPAAVALPETPAPAAAAETVAAESAASAAATGPPAIPAPGRPAAASAAPGVAAVFSTATSGAASPVAPTLFDEPVAKIGAAEARDLDAPEDDLVPDVLPAPPLALPSTAALLPALPALPAPGPAVRQPALDGLNFRMIQYARTAVRLVEGRQDFGVIYAPGWPAWLAALEVHNRSGMPLVLYVAALASDAAPLAERGWLLSVERLALRRATLVLVPSAEMQHRLQALHGEISGALRIVAAEDETAVRRALSAVALDR